MIAYLRGELLGKSSKTCLVLTPSGVGYELTLGAQSAARLPRLGEEVSFYVHAQVREDGTELFGFWDESERRVFQSLIAIPKLGPKTALALLSCYPVAELCLIAAREDQAALAKVPGIGKKSASRMVLELKYALADFMGQAPQPKAGAPADTVFRDALAGLSNLGYSEDQAGPILRQVLEEEPDLDVAQALRLCLKKIAQSK
jgi:Holliday junction DNA helicase RuvA